MRIALTILFMSLSLSANADNCERTLDKAKIESLLKSAATKHNVDYDLLWAVVKQESDFNQCAVSHAGAEGLMQLMPGTAKELGVINSFDPVQNIEGGTKLLAQLLKQFEIPQFALAAYNAGKGTLKRYRRPPPYDETKKYIRAVLTTVEKRKRGDGWFVWSDEN